MRLIVHLGAHRTGTTALQGLLQRRETALEEAGLRFWGPQVMRIGELRDFVPSVVRARGDMTQVAAIAPMVAALHGEFELARSEGARRLLVSEENLLGAMRRNLAEATLYPDATDRLIAAAALFPEPPGEIFLCVRDYADYAVSAFCHLASRFRTGAFDAARMADFGIDRGWPEIVADIRAVFPAARIRVWRYMRDAAMVPGAARIMLGAGRGEVSLPVSPLPRSSTLSQAAVDALAHQPRQARDRKAVARLRKIGDAVFAPYTPTQRARLAEKFNDDWVLLSRGGVADAEIFDPTRLEDAA